jgi:hypothetical protein
MASEKLEQLSQRMYDGYGFSERIGISYFESFAPELQHFHFVDIASHQMANYPHRYALDFLLATPFLWANLTSSIWFELLRRPGVRPDTSRSIDPVGNYVDFEFLCRYVKVDAIRYFIDQHDVGIIDKRRTLDYFRKYAHSLLPDPLDYDDLDGTYFVHRRRLVSLADDLLGQFGCWPMKLVEDDVLQELRTMDGQLSANC